MPWKARYRWASVAVLAVGCCDGTPRREPPTSPASGTAQTSASFDTRVDAPAEPGRADLSAVREWDIAFQTSRSAQSKAVQAATKSPLSHMGIIVAGARGLEVYEAVGPVKRTPLASWVARGADGRVLVKRLRAPISAEHAAQLLAAADAFRGRPYDSAFRWSDDELYCSEFVWKVFKLGMGIELGSLGRFGDFDLEHPDVKPALRERYGSALPMDEVVVSPAAIASSPLLETVGLL